MAKNHFAVFQIEINPPKPHSSNTLTAIAPLWANCGKNCNDDAPIGRADAIAQTDRRFVNAAVFAARFARRPSNKIAMNNKSGQSRCRKRFVR